jgi:hypothetical protein
MHVAFVMFPNEGTKVKQMLASQLAERDQPKTTPMLPKEYERHHKVFSERESQRFPGPRIWDHAIELKKKRSTEYSPWQGVFTHPARTKEPGRVYCRALEEGIYLSFEKSICVPFLLYQKERWEVKTSARLPQGQ